MQQAGNRQARQAYRVVLTAVIVVCKANKSINLGKFSRTRTTMIGRPAVAGLSRTFCVPQPHDRPLRVPAAAETAPVGNTAAGNGCSQSAFGDGRDALNAKSAHSLRTLVEDHSFLWAARIAIAIGRTEPITSEPNGLTHLRDRGRRWIASSVSTTFVPDR